MSRPTDLAPPPPPAWERRAILVLLGLFLVLGTNHIIHGAYQGQDYSMHVGSVSRLLAHPHEWFTQDFTNRPLIYWIALDVMALTGDWATQELTAALFVLFNAAALALFYDCSRRCIASPALRVAALALLATLPVTQITAVVFAADAMAPPFFALLCWSLLRWTEVSVPRAIFGYAALVGAALALGNFAKFTFIGLPVVVLFLALVLRRWQRVSARHLLALLILGITAPFAVGGWLHHRATNQFKNTADWHAFDWRGTGEMTWRSLLGWRTTDTRIFAAPIYWERVELAGRVVMPMLEANAYSYPALLHLATFTDVLNFGPGGVHRSHLPRPAPQQAAACWSVRTGLCFTLAAAAAFVVFWWRFIRAALFPHRAPAPSTAWVLWSVPALAWQLAIMVPLPFVHHAYDWGYWLPRLVLPSLWCFGWGLFVLLDEILRPHRRLAFAVFTPTLLQAALHLRSTWF